MIKENVFWRKNDIIKVFMTNLYLYLYAYMVKKLAWLKSICAANFHAKNNHFPGIIPPPIRGKPLKGPSLIRVKSLRLLIWHDSL